MNIRYRVELSQDERDLAHRAAGAEASTRLARSSARKFCWPPMRVSLATRRLPPTCRGLAGPPSTEPSDALSKNLEACARASWRVRADANSTGREEALLIATACSAPSYRSRALDVGFFRGRDGAADRGMASCRPRPSAATRGEGVEALAEEHVVHPAVEPRLVARMEDVLDLYAENPDQRGLSWCVG